MDGDGAVKNVKAWVVAGTIISLTGCVLTAAVLWRPAPAREGHPGGPGPVPGGPSDVSAGMTIGFTRPRPAMRMNKDLDVELREWSHLVAKGDQSPPAPQPREAWYDAVVGPADFATPPAIPVKLRGHFSNPRLELENGVVYLTGRWILPTTRRIRGITVGGIVLGGSGSPGLPTVGTPVPSGPIVPVPCGNVEEIVEGQLVVFTDAERDVVFFAPGAVPSTVTLVLRQWVTGMASPEEPTPGNEVPECFLISSGNYYVVAFDVASGKQKITPYAWNLTKGTHEQSIKDILNQVNTQVIVLDYTSVVTVLPPLTP